MFGGATVPQVDAHDIETGPVGFVGNTQHVPGRGGTFHAMPGNQRRMICGLSLPTAMREYARAAFDFEQPRFVFTFAPANPAGPEMPPDGLRVGLPENTMRNKS